MDQKLARLNSLFPGSKYVQVPKLPEGISVQQYAEMPDTEKRRYKVPMTQWKSTPLTYDQALKIVDAGYRVGWVVPKGYVIVDVDTQESADAAERLLTHFSIAYSYMRTARGTHFLFTDPNVGTDLEIKTDAVTKCSIGLTVDHRCNGTGYIILPTNDPLRSWGEIRENVGEIPFWLKPLFSHKNQIDTFVGMGEGGRNVELFQWRGKLVQSGKLTGDEIAESIRIINEHLFISPLSKQELDTTVLRHRKGEVIGTQSKQTLSVLEKENIYNSVAKKMTQEFKMISVGGTGQGRGTTAFFKFENSYYRPMREIDVEKLIYNEISENIPAAGRAEIMRFAALRTDVDPMSLDNKWNRIAVRNGILDIVTGKLVEPDDTDLNTIFIPWNYNRDPAHSPIIDEFMAHLAGSKNGRVDTDKMLFLYQIAGYCLLKRNYFGKVFVFQGDGQTGKSTFQDVIVKMVGETNRARVSLDKMDADYYLATLLSKLVNIDDDAVDGKVLENTGRFKSLVTGNEITVRQIFTAPITFTPFATCMFSCNKLPRIMDRTSGLYRRLVIIELNNKVLKPNPLFVSELTTRDMEYFIYKAVQAIGLALKEGSFRISQSEQELLRKFKCRQSSLNEWVYENGMKLKDFYNTGTGFHYALYAEWCQKNGYKLPSALSFKEDICMLFNLELRFKDGDQRAAAQIFTRATKPDDKELDSMPF